MIGELPKLKSDTGAVRLRVEVNPVQYCIIVIKLFWSSSGIELNYYLKAPS
jgi:hypothetical protein